MKYSNRKVKTEGSSCSNSTILNWEAYCRRPWKEPSIATGGTSFPCGLSMLHWVSLFCWSFRLGMSITSHEVGGRQLCIRVGGRWVMPVCPSQSHPWECLGWVHFPLQQTGNGTWCGHPAEPSWSPRQEPGPLGPCPALCQVVPTVPHGAFPSALAVGHS